MSAPIPSDNNLIFSEKLRWSIGLWLFLAFIIASINIVIWAAFGNDPTQLALAISLLALLLLWISSPLKIRVTKSELTTGNFKISRNYLKEVTPLNKSQMRLIRGMESNPAAHLEVRFWVHTGVMIKISDELDPTPYILISSRKYKELSTILTD